MAAHAPQNKCLQDRLDDRATTANCALEPGPSAGRHLYAASHRTMKGFHHAYLLRCSSHCGKSLFDDHAGAGVVSGGCSYVFACEETVPQRPYLLKAHIDYLLMTGLLMIFYLLFAHFRLSVSPIILVAMSVGSFMNPVGFLILAIKPDTRQQPSTPFGVLMTGSFTLTTIEYAGAAWYVADAAILVK
jgi:hypothetical protein